MKQTVDHIEGGNLRGTPGIGQAAQQIRQAKHRARVLEELLELATRIQQPRRDCSHAPLPPDNLIPLQATSLVLAAASAGTGQIPGRPRWHLDRSCLK
jgi:hypothetical protein